MKPTIFHAAVAVLAGVAAPALHAAPRCTNADLKGAYGMLATGTIIVAPGFPPALLGPFARVGQVVADGRGNMSVANSASYNGVIIPESYGGTYAVHSDCTVEFRPVVPLPIGPNGSLVPVPFEFVGTIADNGNSVAAVLCGLGPGVPCFPNPLPTGNVIRALLSRMDANRSRCSNNDLSGGFQLDMSGTVVNGPIPGPFARDGRLVFDGRGEFAGQAVAVYSGFSIQAENISGSYSVGSDCNISITFTDGTGAHTWTGALTEAGDGTYLIVAEPGVVIVGSLKKQKPGREQD